MAATADAAVAYSWTGRAPVNIPATVPEIHKEESHGLGAAIDSTVQAVIDHTPLKKYLEEVTGNADLLHSTAQQWLSQAHAAQQIAQALKSGARGMDGSWGGNASAAFGAKMGDVVGQVEAMAEDMAQTANIVNSAAQECQFAHDMIQMIIRELIEWLAMTLATTAVADLLTFGLATVVGALVDAGEVAAAVARAEGIVQKLLKMVDDLVKMLKEIEEAGKAAKSAEGLSKLQKVWKIHNEVEDTVKGFKKAEDYGKVSKIAFNAIRGQLGSLPMQQVFGAAFSPGPSVGGSQWAGSLGNLGKGLGIQAAMTAIHDYGMPALKGDSGSLSGLFNQGPAPYHLPATERPPSMLVSPQPVPGNGPISGYLSTLQAPAPVST